ncbi:RagB/SusD family nutrient uptake outer membrane protein [Confluentibacter sediminis]|uniref:RagB/SusD family nutrient uptake outer membrane protein n=1 Tax=Confluentibacter sediminis TaxID=2219045 RepID=UPI000DAD4D03|nr:RagB/SusD family nutrient uptake outer membrane protein [Confluentibacter sediminis]
MKNNIYKYIFVLITVVLYGCDSDWLEVKQNKQLVVPETITDVQALLDNSSRMNFSKSPMLGVIGTDNFYIQDEDWAGIRPEEQNAIIWAETIYTEPTSYSYNSPYLGVLYANVALESINNISPTTEELEAWNNAKGSALFYRAWLFFQLSQVYCKQYDVTTAGTDLGIALRLEPDVTIKSTRSTVQETYDRIIKDTKEALDLLPNIPLVQTRPCKVAANGFLAKVYLQMGNYEESLKYAKASLDLSTTLLDYNDLDPSVTYPFDRFNEETIFISTLYPFSDTFNRHYIDSTLYGSYDDNDLRKSIYYFDDNGRTAFRGTYDGSTRQFNGLATDEIYLMAAECEARLEHKDLAMDYLNDLLVTRWATGTFEPFIANSSDEALQIVLRERRKSLIFRGSRWMDLRRLNQEPEFAMTLERTINGQTYTLPPNDERYVLPLPDDVIELSGMEQNPR